MQDLAERFATQMRQQRETLGMTQAGLAAKLGIDRNAISRIERLAPNMSVVNATAIAKALDTSLSAMFGGTESTKSGEEILAEFASRVRELRSGNAWNQREFAQRIGVDRNWVSLVESGKSNVTFGTLEKFAEALGVSPLELL